MSTNRQVPLSDETITRLKGLARPLEDTFDTVIGRLLDFYEARGIQDRKPETEILRQQRLFDPFDHPSLAHSKVTFASCNGQEVRAPSWNALLYQVLRTIHGLGGPVQRATEKANVNVVTGSKTDDGYHYLPDIGISVQGQDSNGAWRAVAQLARTRNLSIEVHFLWRHKQGAALPGDKGVFRIQATDIVSEFERGSR